MTINRVVQMLSLAVALYWLHAAPVDAGDGFPPFGAWAYGSGTTTHLHRHHFRHRYPITTHYHAARYLSGPSFYYGHRYRPYGYRSFSISYASYSPRYAVCVQRPVVQVPVLLNPILFSPVQPVFYSAPSCYWPTSHGSSVFSYPTSSYPNISYPINNFPLAKQTTLPAAPDILASTQLDKALPDSVLEAADAIMRAGGYREAARAYAQLTARYGPSDALFARRFVAQIASGDLEQAVVISSSAGAAGYKLERASLPSQSLNALGMDHTFVAARSEALAAEAYTHPDDFDALAALGHWMHMAGDTDRSQLFLARADQLAAGEPGNIATRSSKAEFVSLD